MKYLGGKARLAKKFAPVLVEALGTRGGYFVEPFVGGFNLAPALGDAISFACYSDVHPGLIALYIALRDGTFDPPEELSEADYQRLRSPEDWADPLTAFAAFGCSFGGKEWGGYARDGKGIRNYAREAARLLNKKRPFMINGQFNVVDFTALAPEYAVVYADPPYEDTTDYKGRVIDHDEFWRWCGRLVNDGGCRVFVSEFRTPPDPLVYNEVWSTERSVTVARGEESQHRRVDRLFEILG